MNKSRDSIETLARPLSAGVYHAFTFETSLGGTDLGLVYQPGRISPLDNRYLPSESLLRALSMDVTVREWFLELFGPQVDPSDYLSSYFADRVAMTLSYLKTEYGLSYMLLRGSEVSLDRLVQLHDSPVHHRRSKEVPGGTLR